MKKTLIFAAIFALLAMIYVPKAMHTYQGSNVGGGYRFIFDQRNTSVAFFQLLVNVIFASGLGALLAQVPKRFLIAGAAVLLVYVGITSITAMICNDNGNDLVKQRKYTEAAQAYHRAAIWWRAALRPDQAREDDAYSSWARGLVTALQ
jgi:hypothetical protein